MFREAYRNGIFLILMLSAGISCANNAYTGLRGGILLTSPGSYADIAAFGLVSGYQFPGCCWSAEAEIYSSTDGGSWQGQGVALSAVYRANRIGSDKIIFGPKFKIGAVKNHYNLSGIEQTNTTINLGIGILIGDHSDIFEFEISGSTSRLGATDEVLFFYDKLH